MSPRTPGRPAVARGRGGSGHQAAEAIAVVVHPDENVADLVQFELAQHGIAARALVPTGELSLDALVALAPDAALLCVVGTCAPYDQARALLCAFGRPCRRRAWWSSPGRSPCSARGSGRPSPAG